MKRLQLILAGILFTAMSLIAGPSIVSASGETITGTANYSITRDETITFSDLQVQGSGNDVLQINLFVPYGNLSMSTVTGLDFTGLSTGNNLNFSGTRSNINNALRTLKFEPSLNNLERSGVNLQVTIGGLENSVYSPITHHLYQTVRDVNTWQSASNAAIGYSFSGASGYLATITSQDEQDAARLLNRGGWLGATDSDTEGEWNWVAGPESGQTFWNGAADGSIVQGYFANWVEGMPDNYSGSNPSGEQCLELYDNDGHWNDQNCDGFQVGSYVVEYGDPDNLFNLTYKNIDIQITQGKDLNRDGTEDIKQQNVRDFLTAEGKWISIALAGNCSFSNASLVNESGFSTQDLVYNYNGGLLDFTASCGASIGTTVRLYYYDETADGLLLRKYNPITNQYSDMSGSEDFSGVSDRTFNDISYAYAQYPLIDGGYFDTDGEVNGQFSDPIGIATIAPPEPPATNAEDQQSQNPSQEALAKTGQNQFNVFLFSVSVLTLSLIFLPRQLVKYRSA